MGDFKIRFLSQRKETKTSEIATLTLKIACRNEKKLKHLGRRDVPDRLVTLSQRKETKTEHDLVLVKDFMSQRKETKTPASYVPN